MTDKNKEILDQFTIEELVEALERKRDPSEWWSEDHDDGEPWWYRWMYATKYISQQVVPIDDGKWECSSHFARPSGQFDTAEQAMKAFEDIPDHFATRNKDEREADQDWETFHILERGRYRVRVYRYWGGWSYNLYRRYHDSDEYYFYCESLHRFRSSLSAQIHAEEWLNSLVIEDKKADPKKEFVDDIVYGNNSIVDTI